MLRASWWLKLPGQQKTFRSTCTATWSSLVFSTVAGGVFARWPQFAIEKHALITDAMVGTELRALAAE